MPVPPKVGERESAACSPNTIRQGYAEGKKGENKDFPFAKVSLLALDLTGGLPCLRLQVWLYFLVRSAADLRQEVPVAIESKAGKNLREHSFYKICTTLLLRN